VKILLPLILISYLLPAYAQEKKWVTKSGEKCYYLKDPSECITDYKDVIYSPDGKEVKSISVDRERLRYVKRDVIIDVTGIGEYLGEPLKHPKTLFQDSYDSPKSNDTTSMTCHRTLNSSVIQCDDEKTYKLTSSTFDSLRGLSGKENIRFESNKKKSLKPKVTEE
jgi:hypothetical protein